MSRARWAPAGVVLLAALAACAAEVPQPAPADEQDAVPVVVDVQAERVLEDVEETLAAGDEALDPALLAPRVAGSALELRQAGYRVAEALPDAASPTVLGGERVLDIVPVTEGWPRYYLSVTRADEAAVPQVLLLTQAAARDAYQLTTYATLLPGVTLPPTALPGEGVEALETGTSGDLVASPEDVVAQYADVLLRGGASEFAGAFDEDAFSAQVQSEQVAEQAAVAEFYGYTVTHVPREDAVWAVSTQDGGAIVIGVIDSVRTPGAKLPLPPDLAALAGKPEASDSAAVTSTEVVAFAVPPADDEGPLQVIGAARAAVGVEAP